MQAEKHVPTKKCGRCKELRAVEEFHRNASRKDGLDPYCKVCKLAYRLSNPEQGRATQQKAYYANLEAERAHAKRRMRLRRALMTAGKEDDPLFAKEWERLCARRAFCCFCCGREKPLHIDYIVPIIRGGRDEITNIQPLCAVCCRRKGDATVDYRS